MIVELVCYVLLDGDNLGGGFGSGGLSGEGVGLIGHVLIGVILGILGRAKRKEERGDIILVNVQDLWEHAGKILLIWCMVHQNQTQSKR